MEYLFSAVKWPNLAFFAKPKIFKVVFEHLHDHVIPHYRNNYRPHILSHRVLALFSALLVSVKFFTFGLLSFGPILPAASLAIDQQNIINLTNLSRKEFGIKDLMHSPVLTSAAQAKANDMASGGYFSHTSPDGRQPWDFIKSAGYNYITAGENLAVNFSQAEDVETAWMNSPNHKANILNQSFDEIGIGIAQGIFNGREAMFVVQMFGTPALQEIKVSNQATVVAPPSTEDITKETENLTLATKNQSLEPEIQVLNNAENLAHQAPLPLYTGAPLEISNTEYQVLGQEVLVKVWLKGEPVAAFLKLGRGGNLLSPDADGSWSGKISLSHASYNQAMLKVGAKNLKGEVLWQDLTSFAPAISQNYSLLENSSTENIKAKVLGINFEPKTAEKQFYLIFAAVLLSCLVLGIAIRRHIQHPLMIANTSLVAVLAVCLWML